VASNHDLLFGLNAAARAEGLKSVQKSTGKEL